MPRASTLQVQGLPDRSSWPLQFVFLVAGVEAKIDFRMELVAGQNKTNLEYCHEKRGSLSEHISSQTKIRMVSKSSLDQIVTEDAVIPRVTQ